MVPWCKMEPHWGILLAYRVTCIISRNLRLKNRLARNAESCKDAPMEASLDRVVSICANHGPAGRGGG